MRQLSRVLFSITLLSFICSSCGVMFGGSKFSGAVAVKDHPNTEIYYNGNKIGKGTSIGLYPRNQPFTVTLKQEGCESKTVTYNKTFRTGNFILSLFTWGLVGAAIDLGSGASYKPDIKNNPGVEKTGDKNFIFHIDYSECPTSSN